MEPRGVLPRLVLVTGTDTGVGKTVVTAALAAHLSQRRTVAVYKPAQTGVGTGEHGDADEVRRLSGVLSVHEGVRLRDPLAPTTAARREGRALPGITEHAATVHALAARHDHVLVEGAGGLLVDLDGEGSGLAELASLLAVPFGFLVVVRAALGTLNHTSLTIEALHRRDLPVLGLVVGSVPRSPDLAEQTNLNELSTVTQLPIVGAIPEHAGLLPPETFRTAATTWFNLCT